MRKNTYTDIDLIKTGKLLKKLILNAGYSVKDIQEYLQLSCPQSIYRWFSGQILPTVGNLFLLSRLLNVHMEEMLVSKEEYVFDEIIHLNDMKENSTEGNNIERNLERLQFYFFSLHILSKRAII